MYIKGILNARLSYHIVDCLMMTVLGFGCTSKVFNLSVDLIYH